MNNTIIYNPPGAVRSAHPYHVRAAGRSRVTPRMPATTSRFNEHTLILTTDGNGQLRTADGQTALEPITLSWVDTSADYRLACAPTAKSHSYLWFSFDGFAVDQLYDQLTRRDQLHASGDPHMIDVFTSVLRAVSAPHPRRYAQLSASVGQALALFENSASGRSADSALQKLTEKITNQLDAPWDTKAMAAVAGLSISRLHAVFRDQFGTPPATWLRAQRITEAKRQLTETDLSIAEIGARCGYPDPPHFSREFSKSALMSPSKFRAQMRERVAR